MAFQPTMMCVVIIDEEIKRKNVVSSRRVFIFNEKGSFSKCWIRFPQNWICIFIYLHTSIMESRLGSPKAIFSLLKALRIQIQIRSSQHQFS